ncbi:DUF4232 domain-containing protein [Streptomyces sp. XD-27]|uniref:DUF4232 domain-containing protein n=1 Tax=Streptomyces sp. XD-27 TaxID=3062779 RepID=UPI0026F461D8|nr:DUF4232 domain-containing protein [Streptomyces sp. XD-27]WKX71428.1 DUF4232 domain-containing protein [Streptomyces sp. XD-27]
MNATAADTRRSRVLWSAVALAAAATLTLTACGSDEDGVKTTGTGSSTTSAASGKQVDEAASDGAGTGSSGGTGSGGTAGTGGAKEQNASDGSKQPEADGKTATCTTAQVSLKVSEAKRPVNHLVLQATNTSKSACNAYGFPFLGFNGDQATMSVFEDSKPQAVTTLAPGRTAYAGIAYASASGEGDNPRKAAKLRVSFAGPSQGGSVGGTAELSLPRALTVDDSASVTYWQSDLNDALTF